MSGLFGASSSAAAGSANTLGDLSKDIALTNPPDDSISDICFSPQADALAVASWDNKVRIYEVLESGASQPKASFDHTAAVFSVDWSKVYEPLKNPLEAS
jgi:mRNA export factor